MKTRQWILKREPEGGMSSADFECREIGLDPDAMTDGQVLVRHQAFLCTPAMRGWMSSTRSKFTPAIRPGDPVIAFAGSVVVASRNPDFPVGTRMTCFGAWQEHQIVDPRLCEGTRVADDLTLIEAVGVLSMNMKTAYFGVTRVGQLQAGETLVVSGAAGSTGSAAMQIGKILGARTIGIAGGKAKCDWLLAECGADAVIDYRTENVRARFAELCPSGINVFYDNVGGDLLQAAVDHIAKYGRIVLCGQIADYDSGQPEQGVRNIMQLVYGGVRMQGFLMHDFIPEWPQAMADLSQWLREGRIHHREDVREGFENVPTIYSALFHGGNQGTLIAMLDPAAQRRGG
jgi:NADPH-dependent curcumin reductase CurA